MSELRPITGALFIPCPEPMPHHERYCWWQHVSFSAGAARECIVCGGDIQEALGLHHDVLGFTGAYVCMPCARDIANAVGAIDRWAAKQKAIAVPDAMVEEAERG